MRVPNLLRSDCVPSIIELFTQLLTHTRYQTRGRASEECVAGPAGPELTHTYWVAGTGVC